MENRHKHESKNYRSHERRDRDDRRLPHHSQKKSFYEKRSHNERDRDRCFSKSQHKSQSDRSYEDGHKKDRDYRDKNHNTSKGYTSSSSNRNEKDTRSDTNTTNTNADAYSPEESWDELASSSVSKTNTNRVNELLGEDSSGNNSHDQVFHDTIFNFNKKTYEKTVPVQETAKHFILNKSNTISVPVKTPTLPEVLKSPPLSARDISNLLHESGANPTSSPVDISEIGTRRPNKNTEQGSSSPLDVVRQKLAKISQASSMNKPQDNIAAPTERLALKYNPHRRVERTSISSYEGGDSPASSITSPRMGDARQNRNQFNVLPSINTHDPRLRKNMSTNLNTSIPFPANDIFKQSPQNSKNQPQNVQQMTARVNESNSPEENWDSDEPVNNSSGIPWYASNQSVMANWAVQSQHHRPQQAWNNPKTANQWQHQHTPVVPNAPTNINKMPSRNMEENWDFPQVANASTTPPIWQKNPANLMPPKNFEQQRNYAQHSAAWSSKPHTNSLSSSNQNPAWNANKLSKEPILDKLFPKRNKSSQPPAKSQTADMNRFDAMRNDVTERSKYFESKKQKQTPNVPRTYAEFKQAKAKAAAEEAARRKEKEKDKLQVEQCEPKNTEAEPATINVESTLDKLYRNSNFSPVEVPSTKLNFKIPKKQNVAIEDSAKVAEQEKSTSKQDETNKQKEQQQEEKKEEKTKADKKSNDKKNSISSKEANKQKKASSCKEETSLAKAKLLADKESSSEKDLSENIVVQSKKDKSKEQIKNKKKTDKQLSKETAAQHLEEDQFPTNSKAVAKQKDTDLAAASKKNVRDPRLKSGEIKQNDSIGLEAAEKVKSDGISKEMECFKSTLDKLRKPIPMTAKENQPHRILKRRCTMITYGSAPEVDKDKLNSANAMLFEDLQERERLKRKEEDEEKQAARRNRLLTNMFQKTDDNCTVSTQNIIIGKRRTRTNVNFNEVQQTQAIFKHKTPKNTNNTSEDAKQTLHENKATASKTKKATATKSGKTKTATDKTVNTEGEQNSAVSSTTDASSMEKEQTDEKEISSKNDDNEPSSSAKSDGGENLQNKQNFLEGCVRDLLKPNADSDHIFNLLRKMLNETQLNMVKDRIGNFLSEKQKVLAQGEAENEEETIAIEVEPQTEPKPDQQNSPCGNNKGKSKNRKKNELDRLNEDIRDMFISEGVLNATGRRSEKRHIEEVNNSSAAEPTNDTSEEPALKVRKMKVVITPLRRSTRGNKVIDITDTDSESHNSKKLDSDNESTPKRPMPTLQPNTPIKLPEEEELEKQGNTASDLEDGPAFKKLKTEPKKVKGKPGPRPKHKPIKIEKEVLPAAESVNIEEPTKENAANEIEKKFLSKPNTNPNSHSQSKFIKYCEICDRAVASNVISSHYLMNHKEHYAARLAPTMLNHLKQGKYCEPLFAVNNASKKTFFYRCPFCLQHNTTLLLSWVEHIAVHLGEYMFKCSKCNKPGNKSGYIQKHIEQYCKDATIERCDSWTNYLHEPQVKAHVCHLCNYMQLNRSNLNKHYMEQHGFETQKDIEGLGYSLVLLNKDNVKYVTEKEAIKLEADAILKFQEENLESILADEQVEVNNVLDKEEEKEAEKPNKAAKVVSEDIKKEAEQMTKKKKKATKKIAEENAKELQINPSIEKQTAKTESQITPLRNTRSRAANASASPCDNSVIIINSSQSSENSFEPIADAEERLTSSQSTVAGNAQDWQDEILTMAANAEQEDAEIKNVSKSMKVNIIADSQPIIIDDVMDVDAEQAQNQLLEMAASAEQEELTQPTKDNNKCNSNIFMPTREANDSPINVSCLMSMDEQDSSNKSKTTNSPKVSIADRISQRFKQSNCSTPTASQENAQSTTSTQESKCSNDDTSVVDLILTDDEISNDAQNEDDDNWEDIEITETANCKSSSQISSSSAGSKDSFKSGISKHKSIFQKFSKLYAGKAGNKSKRIQSMGFMSKMLKTSAAAKAANTTHSTAAPNACTNSNESANVSASQEKVLPSAADTANSNSAFRPMITNLEDLLPESPCNDPIELVPDLSSLEPLQDLNDISSILEDPNLNSLDNQQLLDMSTVNSIFINSNNHQTSIQEALEFVSEQQQKCDGVNITNNANTLNAHPHVIIHRIENVGYSLNLEENKSFKFYCLSEKCTFLYSNEAIGLEGHFISEHPQISWSGYCNICQKNINTESSNMSLCSEIKHLLEKHVQAAEIIDLDDLPEVVQEQQRPRLKLRRLSGDCLSKGVETTTNNSDYVVNENTHLLDLLKSKPRPPTIAMPPKPTMPIDMPLMPIKTITTAEPLFKNVSNEFVITSVSCGLPTEPNAAATTTAEIPKISAVCSLSTKAANMWSQQINEERLEIAAAAAHSQQASNLFAAKNRVNSPDPVVVVAETVPVNQATTGDFVITQTLSAQYEQNPINPQIGININIATTKSNVSSATNSSTTSRSNSEDASKTAANTFLPRPMFKCMGLNCKFQTRVSVSMMDHLHFHECRNFSTQRDYFRCSFCSHMAENVEDYIKHAESKHIKCHRSSSNTSNAETSKDNANETAASNAKAIEVKTYAQKLEQAIKQIVAPTGISGKSNAEKCMK